MFTLHPNLQKKDFICDLPLCRVLLEDAREFPWVFLVPKRENIRNMQDLSSEDYQQLFKEIRITENVLTRLFSPDQTNVAMIGNVTPQLHVHIICRFKQDGIWPNTVWEKKTHPYSSEEKQHLIERIKKELLNV